MNQPTEKRGKLIVFEGPDGFGKTTQAELAHSYLSEKREIPCTKTKEPGSPLFSLTHELREIIFNRTYSSTLDEVEQGLLFFIDHYHQARQIERMVSNGCNIISDRWLYSQYCYDSIKPVSQADAISLYQHYETLQIQPDLVLLFGLDKEEGYRRIKKREEENEKETKQSQKPWATEDYLGELIKQYAYLYQNHLPTFNIEAADIVPKNEENPEQVFEKYVKIELDELFREEGE